MIAENTTQTIHRYPWYIRWFASMFNIAALAMPVYLVGKVILRAIAENVSLSPVMLLVTVFSATFLGAVLIFTANYFPGVNASPKGLSVSFLWYRLRVDWDDIIEIKPSLFNRPSHPTTWVVQTHTLTPIHRLYGLLYTFTLQPSFILHHEIENREDLMQKKKTTSF